MGCTFLTPAVTKRVVCAQSGATLYEPVTDWIPYVGLTSLKYLLVQKASSTLKSQVAYQLATVRTDAPGSWELLESATYLTDDGQLASDASVPTLAGGAWPFYIRFGIAYAPSTGSFGQGEVTVRLSYVHRGQMVGDHTFEARAEDLDVSVEPLTPWIPAYFADSVCATLIGTATINAIEYKLVYQTANVYPEATNTWTDTSDTYHKPPDGEINTGGISLTYANPMWVRFGLKYRRESGTAMAQATMITKVAIRRP